MSRLDRYLLRELLVPLALCLCAFLIIWIAQDLLNEMDRFRATKLTAADMGEYYVYRLLEELPRLMPVALLLALLYSLTTHARHNELIAIRCAGVSLWRMSAPFYALGILLSGGLFLLTDFVFPNSQEAIQAVLSRRQEKESKENADLVQKFNFRNGADGRIWEAASFDKRRWILEQPIVKWSLSSTESRTISARRAYWTNDVWRFVQVTQWERTDADDTPPEQRAEFLDFPAFSEGPRQFLNDIKFSSFSDAKLIKKSRFSLKEILEYLEFKPDLDDAEADRIYTQLHARLATPWTCLVVVMIAIPFASLSGKRNVFVGVASSIAFCFSYFVMQRFGLALGTSGAAPPWAAAWTPNILFAATGLVLTRKAS